MSEANIAIKYQNKVIEDNKVVALMCPKCYGLIGSISQKLKTEFWTIEGGEQKFYGHNIRFDIDGQCEYCGEYIDQYIEIDGDLAATISNLNQKGWKTNFCCAGHPISTSAYIAFKHNHYLKYISVLPKGWKLDVKDYSVMREFIIRSELGKYDPIELYEWSKRLPIIPNTTSLKRIPDKELIDIIMSMKEDQLDFDDEETQE